MNKTRSIIADRLKTKNWWIKMVERDRDRFEELFITEKGKTMRLINVLKRIANIEYKNKSVIDKNVFITIRGIILKAIADNEKNQ